MDANFLIDPNEIVWEFVRSSGPGGQNVNKVATAVQLRFHVDNSESLSDAVKSRLKKTAGTRMNRQGELVINARRYRTQLKNRDDAMQRLTGLIQKAMEIPKVRRTTRPGRAVIEKRTHAKKRHSEKKRLRRTVQNDTN